MGEAVAVRRGRKFDQVLEGARAVFRADGYEGASVDAIARAAGVSKATLYSYFADKRLLFLEVARSECDMQVGEADAVLSDHRRPREVLMVAADRMLAFFLSELGQSIFRMFLAESARFPDLGQAIYETGPQRFRRRMVAYLGKAVEAGDLVIDDLELAADQFAELCKAGLFYEVMFGIRKRVTPEEHRRVVEGAVEMFLARYAAPVTRSGAGSSSRSSPTGPAPTAASST